MSTTRVGVYVDAFNVYYRARAMCGRGTPGWRWLDLAELALSMIKPEVWPVPEVVKLVYCTALRDRDGDPSSLLDQETYIGALCHNDNRIEVITGTFAPRVKSGILVARKPPRRVHPPTSNQLPDWLPVEKVIGPSGQVELLATISTFEEKGSDVNLASQLLIDVLGGQIDAAMVFSNDSDLRLPLAEARRRVPVATINPGNTSTAGDLRGGTAEGAGGHWWRRLWPKDLYTHQFPDQVGPHVKPIGW